jgi:hypothetical protein
VLTRMQQQQHEPGRHPRHGGRPGLACSSREQQDVAHAAHPAEEGGRRRRSRYGWTSPDRTADVRGLPAAPRRRVAEAWRRAASTAAGRSFASGRGVAGGGDGDWKCKF